MREWTSGDGRVRLINGDCVSFMKGLPDNSVDLVLTDPPYFRVKDCAWDNTWEHKGAFLDWLDGVVVEFARVMKPNASLYLFASPQMAAHVEVMIGKRLNVLNSIVWPKTEGWHKKAEQEALRSYFPQTERIIFAEHYNSDNAAKGEAGYALKCDELRGFVFEPLRAYLAEEWGRAGLTSKDANDATQSQMAGHYLTQTQWTLPTEAKYNQLREYANRNGGEFLRREYEDLRREYEDLRRPFEVSADVPYTDVWTFNTVQAYEGKHPCEKPQSILKHIIKASSRPDALVLDAFGGSFSTALACHDTKRRCVSCELDADYYAAGLARVQAAMRQQTLDLGV